jgi:hypothetical protein
MPAPQKTGVKTLLARQTVFDGNVRDFTFAVVTAEPYFAVSRPSGVVVMENEVRPDTAGKIEPIEARYELLQLRTSRAAMLSTNWGKMLEVLGAA